MINEQEIVEQAKELPINGSLTFKMLVIQRDWEAVYAMAPELMDSMHGVNLLRDSDWQFIDAESVKDRFKR